MKLYDGPRSPNARKIRLFAAELSLPLERVTLDFAKGDYRAPDFVRKNPNGKIPVLEDDGLVLWESAAILRHLARKRPDAGFVPRDAHAEAKLDQWMFWWAAHVEPAMLMLVLEKFVKPFLGGVGNEAILGEANAALARFLPVLEGEVGDRPYLLGAPTLLDFDVAPWLETSERLGVDLATYPKLRAWLAHMQAKPYWTTA